MNYLLDKKIKQRKFSKILLGVVVLFTLIYFRKSFWNGLSYTAHTILRPVLISENNIGDKFKNWGTYFVSKDSLRRESEDLKSQINQDQAKISNYNSVLSENVTLKEILGRKNEKISMILGGILAKPNQSPYDTLIIDVGVAQGVKVGDTVFAFGDVPIGRVSQVYGSSSNVVLFSTAGEKTQVVLSAKKDIFMQIIGRGGGNFEMTMPRDLVLSKGDEVLLPSINPYVLAVVETVISDPRDPFVKALLVSPVNIQELKFVEVEK